MLQKLHITNFAIIDKLVIDFSPSLNIITGETGAGKSILMDALNLILGERAESSVLMDKGKKCVVEGVFTNSVTSEINTFLILNELDAAEELLLRREIGVNGKSRAFVNDTPVNLNQLKTLGYMLVDLHQQFDTLELGENSFQREVLDAMADNVNLMKQYAVVFNQYIQSKKEWDALLLQQQNANAALDYNQFLFDELDEAGFKENELEELDLELKLLSNVENVKEQLNAVYFELSNCEQPIVQQIKLMVNKLHAIESYHLGIEEITRRLQSSQIELIDIAGEIESLNNLVHYNPERIQVVNDKIALGYRLLKKHHASTTQQLLAIKDSLQLKLDDILNLNSIIERKEIETNELLSKCKKLALVVTKNRGAAIKPFVEKVNVLLKQVGMPNAQLQIALESVALHQYGSESISFLFDANRTNRFLPISKVASGGELSRLMLCIKSLVATKLQLPTLIFDEIDTGISGEAARQVGSIMQTLSSNHQLISITHQPQIAALAHHHYYVYKAIQANKVVASIRLLSKEERINAIAQMLSGEKPTVAAIENAREMVRN